MKDTDDFKKYLFAMMKRIVQLTNDGSTTIFIDGKNISYHNTDGAIGESKHVFIEAGLKHIITHQNNKKLVIFEMGFGTGLNALLTYQVALENQLSIDYTAIELYPILQEEITALNIGKQLQMEAAFDKLHETNWEDSVIINDYFTLNKINQSLINFSTKQEFNLIYYDAFAPNDQPELWTSAIFKKLYNILLPNGILVTYCSKGDVKRTMKAVGFKVERVKGFANKWHMIRATKAH